MSSDKPTKGDLVLAEGDRSARVSRAISAGMLGAGAALVGVLNPALGVIAGGMAPLVQASLDDIFTRRSVRLRRSLDANGIELERLGTSGEALTDDKILLLQEAITAALGTDSEEKVEVIIRLLKIGLDAAVETDVLSARRFARTVARLDEVELRTILVLEGIKSRPGEKASLQVVTERTHLGNPDLVRSGLSTLESEGLVRLLPGAIETWSLTDFGRRLVLELTLVFGRTRDG